MKTRRIQTFIASGIALVLGTGGVEMARADGPDRSPPRMESSWAGRAAAWERALAGEPTAQIEYRDLLTRLCETERRHNPGFACVVATDSSYYLACPPDEAVMEFLRRNPAQEGRQPPGFALERLLAEWWPKYGDPSRSRERPPTRTGESSGYGVWEMSPGERSSMWRPESAPTSGFSLGLIPVALQPPADRSGGWSPAYASPEPRRPAPPPAYTEPREGPPPAPVPPPPVARNEPEPQSHVHESEHAPVVRADGPSVEEREVIEPRPAMVKVTVERSKESKVKSISLTCELDDWDKDKWEDWSDKLEDEFDIDEDWWQDRFDEVDAEVHAGGSGQGWIEAGKSVRYLVERY